MNDATTPTTDSTTPKETGKPTWKIIGDIEGDGLTYIEALEKIFTAAGIPYEVVNDPEEGVTDENCGTRLTAKTHYGEFDWFGSPSVRKILVDREYPFVFCFHDQGAISDWGHPTSFAEKAGLNITLIREGENR